MNGESRPQAASATLASQDTATDGDQLEFDLDCDPIAHENITYCERCGWSAVWGALPF
jgi:hypothetical protein